MKRMAVVGVSSSLAASGRAMQARGVLRIVLVGSSLLLLAAGCSPKAQIRRAARADRGPVPRESHGVYKDLRGVLRDLALEAAPDRRSALVSEAVALGRRCQDLEPASALCAYGLALALGVQAREKPSTAYGALPDIVRLLELAAAANPWLDRGGPERVLALLLVRAPGWPAGPGDPDAGLEAARRAATRDPAYPPNWLALAEAADAVADEAQRQEAARNAKELAAHDEREAAQWQRDAAAFLEK